MPLSVSFPVSQGPKLVSNDTALQLSGNLALMGEGQISVAAIQLPNANAGVFTGNFFDLCGIPEQLLDEAERPVSNFEIANLLLVDNTATLDMQGYAQFSNQSINQSKRKTSNANGQTNLGHKHKAPDHNHEATQPMVDLPHTS